MPTFADPAEWIPELMETNWQTAVESLREQGRLVSSNKPNFKPTGRPGATQSIKNAVSAKVYRATDERNARVTHGDLDEDSEVDWGVKFDVGAEYQLARSLVREVEQVAHRLLLLFRDNPHPEWQRIENIRSVTSADYSDWQSRTVLFTLKRFGDPTPTVIRQVTT